MKSERSWDWPRGRDWDLIYNIEAWGWGGGGERSEARVRSIHINSRGKEFKESKRNNSKQNAHGRSKNTQGR